MGLAQGVEHLPSKCKTMSSNPSATKKIIRRQKIARRSLLRIMTVFSRDGRHKVYIGSYRQWKIG
jgi:hypothetical protein